MTVIHVLHEGGHWQAHLEIPGEVDAYRTVSNWAELVDFADEQGVVIGPGILDVSDQETFVEEFGPAPSNVRLR